MLSVLCTEHNPKHTSSTEEDQMFAGIVSGQVVDVDYEEVHDE